RRPRARRGPDRRRRDRMSVKVEVHGLELHGRHGVGDEERRDGQTFAFDVELDVSEAALSDRIEDAVDYRDAVAIVRRVSDGTQFRLLEALAAAVADAIAAELPVERVRVRVRKPQVQLGAPVEHTAATVERP
ncbi:MAG: dihydroneopterin aldolase, partial [Actinomycetota bacterium]|nr:dihydroneopterin aldolase [Actinomycetota bacterium]